MKKRQPCIYKITNLIDGKVYIGQTILSFEKRIYAHKSKLKFGSHPNVHLQNAWCKYGEENFSFEVIEFVDLSEIDKKEIHYISLYDSYVKGYNRTTGGNQVMRNRQHTLTAKKKMSEKLKRRWSDEKFREKMGNRPVYKGAKSPRSIPIICINDQKIFHSMLEASKHYGISLKQISTVCTNECKYTGLRETGRKLQFSYYEKGKEYKLKNIVHGNEKIKVKCLTTGEIFNSMNEAGIKMGVSGSSISHVCKGKRNFAGKLSDGTKLKWTYYKEHLSI